MGWFKRISERAKSIEAEATSLISIHGNAAPVVAYELEQQANNRSTALYRRAVKSVVIACSVGTGNAPSLSIEHSNCISCFVKIFGIIQYRRTNYTSRLYLMLSSTARGLLLPRTDEQAACPAGLACGSPRSR